MILFAKNAPDSATLRGMTGSSNAHPDGAAPVATDQEGGDIRSVPFAAPRAHHRSSTAADEAAG